MVKVEQNIMPVKQQKAN